MAKAVLLDMIGLILLGVVAFADHGGGEERWSIWKTTVLVVGVSILVIGLTRM